MPTPRHALALLPALLALSCERAGPKPTLPRPRALEAGVTAAGATAPPVPFAPHAMPLLAQFAETQRFSCGAPAHVVLAPDGGAVFFLRSGPRDAQRELFRYDVAARTEARVLTAGELLGGAAETLSPEERARRERQRQTAHGITDFSLSPDGSALLVPLSGRLFLHTLATHATRELTSAGQSVDDARFSPDGARLAVAREHNVSVLELASNRLTALTTDGTEERPYGVAEFIAQEEMDRSEGFWWSPDGTQLAIQRSDLRAVDRMVLSDPAHPERPPSVTPYPRAGHSNALVSLFTVPSRGGALRQVRWDDARFPYLARVFWPEGSALTLLVQDRRQREELLLRADAAGATQTVLTEHDDAWLELPDAGPTWLGATGSFLWPTEQSGQWQLELHPADGSAAHIVNAPELNLRRIVHHDPVAQDVYVLAGEEPAETHLYRVPLDPARGAPEDLTPEHVEVDAWFARRNAAHVRQVASLDGPTRWLVFDAQGHAAGALRSVVEEPLVSPHVTLRTVGARQLRSSTVRPANYDSRRRYPVLLWVYGGPGVRMVSTVRARFALAQWFAEQGMVVVSIDGRGTPARGREWSRALLEHLGDVPLADQLEGLDALVREDTSLDAGHVGITGWSYGGFLSGYAAEHAGTRFRAAVAGAPVTDWRLYDTHYTERFLGLPDDHAAAYEASSLVAGAPQLGTALLVVHGTADDNVYFANSLQWLEAVQRAGLTASFLPLAGSTHIVAEPERVRSLYVSVARFLAEQLKP